MSNKILGYSFVDPTGFFRVGGCFPGKLDEILSGYNEPVTNLRCTLMDKSDFDQWRDNQKNTEVTVVDLLFQ